MSSWLVSRPALRIPMYGGAETWDESSASSGAQLRLGPGRLLRSPGHRLTLGVLFS